jgi:hypothetical protein
MGHKVLLTAEEADLTLAFMSITDGNTLQAVLGDHPHAIARTRVRPFAWHR